MGLSFPIIVNILCLWFLPNGEAAGNLLITLNEPSSRIRGHVLKSYRGLNYNAFQDIPYAAPPIGENRFAEPKIHPGWTGILDTTENKKECMQSLSSGTEDCLVLNVYSPARNNNSQLPILFWIHGGAFLSGSGQLKTYDPQYFVDYGIIVVTINYRLGALGFLTTEDGIIPGNLGLKDQVLALKWVNKNIALFGGDPNKITIAGQSAGAIAASYLIVSQKATGLYRAAILESGTALLHGSYIDHARNYAFQLGRLLEPNFTSNNSKELLQVLRRSTARNILSAARRVQAVGNQVGLLRDLVWSVVIENANEKNALITQPMHSSFKNGEFDKVPILIGYTSEEMLLFVISVTALRYSAAAYDRNLANLVSPKLNIPERNGAEVGSALKKLYTNRTFVLDLQSFVSISSDIGFVNPIIRQADLSSASVPVFMYEFTFKGAGQQIIPINIPSLEGVAHAEELFYMWFMTSSNSSDTKTSRRLLTMWSNFVKNLHPASSSNLILGIPIWQRVQPNNLRYMDIGNTLTIKSNPKKYTAVKPILNQYIQPPFNVY